MPSRHRTLLAAPLIFLLTLLATVRSHGDVSHGTTPTARDDSAATDDQTAITIDVLANDEDPDGDLLTVVPQSASCDGNPIQLVNYHDGSLGFPSVPGYCGFCDFTYDLLDPSGRSARASVSVAVALADGSCDPNTPCLLLVTPLPPSETFTVGQNAALAVEVAGHDALTTYQWHKDGLPLTTPPDHISGETTRTLQFAPVRASDAGSYELIVSQPNVCQRSSQATLVSLSEDTADEVFDDFLVNGIDREWGDPLHDTFTELGGRRWIAHPQVVLGSGFIQVAEDTTIDTRGGGFAFDPADFPGRPVITLEASVHANRQGVWGAIGLSESPASGLQGSGLVWVRIASNGSYSVRTRGTTDPPLATGVYPLDPEFGAIIKLEIDLAAGTVSAWLDDEQVLFRSHLPAGWQSWLTPSSVSLQIRYQAQGLGAPMTIGHIRATASADGSHNQAPFLGLPVALPGTLEGWQFDLGGEGVAYHDVDTTNTGNVERTGGGIEGTDLWQAQGGSTAQVESFDHQEWLEYSVTTSATPYKATFEVAAPGAASTIAGTVGLSIGDGPLIGGPWSVPGTGGNITTIVGPEPVTLPASGLGTTQLRLRVLSGTIALRRAHFTPWASSIDLDDDVVVLTAPDTAEAIDFPLASLLAGDEPAGDVEITAIPTPWVRLNDDGTATYFPGLRGFWSRGWDRFTYQAAHVDDPSVVGEATVTLLAGGLLAADDHAVTLCTGPGTGSAPQLDIPFADLLANDTPGDPSLVAITGVAQQPSGGVGTVTVDAANQRFIFQPDPPFCTTSTVPSFRYRSVLIEDPTIQTTGKVSLHGNNPVVALDDTIDFVFSDLGSDLSILHDEILANDEPDNLSIQNSRVGPSDFGAQFELGLQRTIMTPDAGFWARGFDIVDYTAELTTGLEDSARITVRAVPKAARDTVIVPFEPRAGTLTLGGALVLDNDGPLLSPPVIDVFGASDGALGDLEAFAGDLLYSPTEAFWRQGTDAATYEVWYRDSSQAAASAPLSLVAETAFHTVDRAWALPNLDDPFIFFQSQLLATDVPNGHVVFDSFDGQTLAGGTLSLGGDCGGAPCGKMQYDAPANGQLPLGYDRLTYRIRLVDGPAETRTGHVYLFADSLPPLSAADDAVMVDAGVATELLFSALTANDVTQGGTPGVALVQAPIHGSLVQAADRFVYTPDPGYVGADFFRYATIEAGTGRKTASATVEITVDQVLAPGDDHFLVDPETPGQALSVANLLSNDHGAPGDIIFEHAGRPRHGTLLDLGDELVYDPDAVAFATAGTDSFLYTVSLAEDPSATSRALVHLEADLGCDNGFADAFESGDLSAWDLTSAIGSTLIVDETGALEGQYGLTAVLHDGATNAFVHDNSPTDEVHFRSQFLLDLDGLDLPEGGRFVFVNARTPTNGAAYHLEIDSYEHQHRIRAKAVRDDGSQAISDWVVLGAGSHSLIVDWWASAAPGLDDGGLRLFLDRHRIADLQGLDNDQRRIEQVRFGAIFGIDPRTVGPMRFDDYRSCRGTRTPVVIGEDDFEDGDLAGWNGVTAQGGGSIQTSAAAALDGQVGLEVVLVPGTQILYLEDNRPANESSFWTALRFDPNSLPLDRGDHLRILTGEQPGASPFLLFFGRGDDGYRMRLAAQQDSGSFAFAPWVAIPDQPIDLMLAWQASDAGNGLVGSGTPTGHLRLWIDGTLVSDLPALDNDTRRVDRIRLGARQGLPAGPGGSLYFDNYRSWSTP